MIYNTSPKIRPWYLIHHSAVAEYVEEAQFNNAGDRLQPTHVPKRTGQSSLSAQVPSKLCTTHVVSCWCGNFAKCDLLPLTLRLPSARELASQDTRQRGQLDPTHPSKQTLLEAQPIRPVKFELCDQNRRKLAARPLPSAQHQRR